MIQFITSLFRLCLTIVIIGASGYFTYSFYQKQSKISEYNQAIVMINSGELVKVIPKLKGFIKSHNKEMSENAENELVKVYKRLGDDTGKTTKECVEYYQLALGIDPDCLDEKQKKLVDSNRKLEELYKNKNRF